MSLFKKKQFAANENITITPEVKPSPSVQPPKPKIDNWATRWWNNMRNTRKNYKKVRASPYASLSLALKARKIIVSLLVPYLIYLTYSMVKKYHATGFMGTVGRIVMIGVMGYVCWKIYQTIPQAKAQIDYYKKYPHLVNYCPTDVKEDVDSIFAKIEENQKKAKGGEDNGIRITGKKEGNAKAGN